MVGKLFKYEMRAYARTLLPIEMILIAVGFLTRFIAFFENDTVVYGIVSISSYILMFAAVAVTLVMTMAVAVMRFYKNLFTAEGYLSFTLPVTPAAHIAAKLLAALVFCVISAVCVAISLSAATMGELFVEILKFIGFMSGKYFERFGVHGVFYIVEGSLLAAVSITKSLLVFYLCISLGQLAKKNRVLAAFGYYCAYIFIIQIIGTFFIIFFTSVVDAMPNFIADLFNWFYEYQFLSKHVMMLLGIFFTGIISLVYFLIIRFIISKKLNLE